MPKNILVTGGLGYIGSHCVVELIAAGYYPYIYDNLSNSNIEVLNRIHEISGTHPKFIQGDITDQRGLESAFEMCDFDGVLHFAGLKSVGESALKPVEYYENNVFGSLQLLKVMALYDHQQDLQHEYNHEFQYHQECHNHPRKLIASYLNQTLLD